MISVIRNFAIEASQWLSSKESSCWRHSSNPWVGTISFLEKEMAAHSSFIAWSIPWSEEPRELQSMGSQKSQAGFLAIKQQQQSTKPVEVIEFQLSYFKS